MWPDIKDAASGLVPFRDQHRVRRHDETERLVIGARWPLGGNDAMHLGERSVKEINPRMAEATLFKHAGAAYPRTPEEGWRKYHATWPGLLSGDYYNRIVDWLAPGIANGRVTPEFGPVPYVQHIRPHGGISRRETYGYFDAIEAAELGQPWLVDQYYQSLRDWRNNGIDHIVHLGMPDRNEEWAWRSDEAKQQTIAMVDYSKCPVILDNAITVGKRSISREIVDAQLAKGLGAGVEGTPNRDNTAWDDCPCQVLSWADTTYRRHIEGRGNYVVMGRDSEFGDRYGGQEWTISFGTHHFGHYGVGSTPTWQETEKVKAFLDGVAEKTRAYFISHAAQPNQGKLVCLLDHRIINLAISDGRTVADFIEQDIVSHKQ